MVTLYEKLENAVETVKMLTREGLLDPHWLRDLDIYKSFESIKKDCILCRYELLSDKFGLSSDHIKRIILKMKK